MTASTTTLSGAIAFCDIVGFTELTADHGDEVALALVEQHESLSAVPLPDGAAHREATRRWLAPVLR